jgi:hypothetical protein
VYLQGIDPAQIIDTVHSRPAPVISATAGLTRPVKRRASAGRQETARSPAARA